MGAQIQGGCTIAEAFGGADTRLRIIACEDRPNHVRISVRVASLDRAPVFAVAVCRWHRTIPADAMVKWAYVVRRRVGATDHHEIQLTVSRLGGFADDPRRAAEGSVGIDVGWRQTAEGVRVAVAVGSDGVTRELVIPQARIDGLREADGVEGIRDVRFNHAIDTLRRWLAGEPAPAALAADRAYVAGRLSAAKRNMERADRARMLGAIDGLLAGWASPRDGLPEPLAERAKFLHAWKSQSRLASLVLAWREHRFTGDEAIYEWLEAWRRQDKHLWNYAAHRVQKFSRWRREHYRLFAVELRRAYAGAVIEDTDWRKLAKLPAVESPEHAEQIARARWNRRVASPGMLSATLKNFGPLTRTADARDTTRTCSACGHVEAFDAARAIHHVCGGCEAVLDQDANAAANLLASDEVVSP